MRIENHSWEPDPRAFNEIYEPRMSVPGRTRKDEDGSAVRNGPNSLPTAGLDMPGVHTGVSDESSRQGEVLVVWHLIF